MLRVLLITAAISFVVGVFPAFAQGGAAARSGVALIVAVAGMCLAAPCTSMAMACRRTMPRL